MEQTYVPNEWIKKTAYSYKEGCDRHLPMFVILLYFTDITERFSGIVSLELKVP